MRAVRGITQPLASDGAAVVDAPGTWAWGDHVLPLNVEYQTSWTPTPDLPAHATIFVLLNAVTAGPALESALGTSPAEVSS